MFKDGVRDNHICQNITILNYVKLVECKMVIYDKDFVDRLAWLNIIISVIDTGHDSIGLRCGLDPSQFQLETAMGIGFTHRTGLDAAWDVFT